MRKITKLITLFLSLGIMQFSALTVSAGVSTQPSSGESADTTNLEESTMSHSQEQDVYWMISLHEGQETVDDFGSLTDFYDLEFLSAKLEADRIYRVNIDIMAEYDPEHPTKFEDAWFQVRFPQALLAHDVNALGSAIFGSEIKASDFCFGLTADQNLRLSYVAGSGHIIEPLHSRDSAAYDESMLALLSNADGAPIGELLHDSIDLGGLQLSYVQISFLIYASPLEGKVQSDEIALDHWASRDLMGDFVVTPAPTQAVYTVAMDESGEIIFPEAESKDGTLWIMLAIIGALLLGCFAAINLWAKQHYGTNTFRAGCKLWWENFIEHFLDVMKLGADDDYEDPEDDWEEALKDFECLCDQYSTEELYALLKSLQLTIAAREENALKDDE